MNTRFRYSVALGVALPSVVHHGVAGRSGHDARVFINKKVIRQSSPYTAIAQVFWPRPAVSNERELIMRSLPGQVLTTQ